MSEEKLFVYPTYTQCPNAIFDYWMRILGHAELKVLMTIVRKTIGWHKNRDKISLSQIETFTGLERKYIAPAVESLIEKKLIKKEVTGSLGSQETFYEMVMHEYSINSYQCPKDTSVLKTPTKESNALRRETVPLQKRSEDYEYKKNDNVREAKVSEDKVEPIRSSENNDRSSYIHNSNRSFDRSSFDPFKYEMPNGEKLSLRMAKGLTKYSEKDKFKLYANISYFEEKIKAGLKPDRPEAYLQTCIKYNYAGKEESTWQNKLYAIWAKEEHKLRNLEILKTVVRIKSDGSQPADSINYSISVDAFMNILDKYIEKETK
jgi:phage replication O-like protein O